MVVAEERNVRKVRVGKVVSNKMDKTIVVSVERKVPHALYNKPMVTSKRFKAHDETMSAKLAIQLNCRNSSTFQDNIGDWLKLLKK